MSAVAVLLLGCAGPVEVTAPPVVAEDATACAALLAALPDSVGDLDSRDVSPAQAHRAAAWGDPAVVLVCGGRMPAEFDGFTRCEETGGVGWFIAEESYRPGADVRMTTIGWSPVVEVTIPAEHLPPALFMVELAPAITDTLTLEQPCR
ncbi:DUF3515 family protein [Nocardioides limicola]|uniref:DUF3515 family protein n=1 Tax=Nocardioides limicola TaxID=2803368 RepID=UPI00193BFD72|nr:DUF3515 family protein [Nocardioides sp. DJM-14]